MEETKDTKLHSRETHKISTSKDNKLEFFSNRLLQLKNKTEENQILFFKFLYPPFESISTSLSNLDKQQGRKKADIEHTCRMKFVETGRNTVLAKSESKNTMQVTVADN